MSVFLFVFGAILLLTVVSGTYVFIIGCVRRKDLPWLVEQEIKKTPYGKYYNSIVASHRWLSDHNARDIYINSEDGLRLHGLWVPAQDSRGTVILAHGYRSSMLVDFSCAFDFYHSQGMNLLIPEQRCHGKSEGTFITFGVKESTDMLQWLQFHNEKYEDCPVIFHGLSMGASTVLYLADKALPGNVRGIIADCGFTSPKDILSSVFTKVTHLPAAPSIWVTELLARLFAGFSLTQCDTRKSLGNNRLPIVMVHGTDDGFVPCEMTRSGFEVCTGEKKLLLVDGADHGVSFLVDPERYTQLVSAFLDAHLENF